MIELIKKDNNKIITITLIMEMEWINLKTLKFKRKSKEQNRTWLRQI